MLVEKCSGKRAIAWNAVLTILMKTDDFIRQAASISWLAV